jgi:hypothetical protein
MQRTRIGLAEIAISAFDNLCYSDDDQDSPYDEAWIVNAGVGFGF